MRVAVFALLFIVLGVILSAEAVPEFAGKVVAVECRPRQGVGRVMEKIRAGEPVKIAYFGGSITEMDGWRRFSREWLQARYPACTFSEIQAAIGGTGSRMGVFRFAQDVLDKKPDLIFVEFATNDASLRTIWRSLMDLNVSLVACLTRGRRHSGKVMMPRNKVTTAIASMDVRGAKAFVTFGVLD